MKVVLYFCLACLFSCSSKANQQNKLSANDDTIEVRNINYIDLPPEFPGGIEELKRYIQSEIDRSDEKYIGRVHLSFIITQEGKIESPTIINSSNENSNEEAIRIVNSLPNFIPATLQGKPVRNKFAVIVDFNQRNK